MKFRKRQCCARKCRGSLAFFFMIASAFTFAWGMGAMPASADNRDVSTVPLDWVSELNRDHPLVGKVWSKKANGLAPVQDMGMAIAKARFTLLGEVHDNVDHHRWQAWAIRNISKLRGARIVEGAPQIEIVAMEMLRADQIPALDKFYGRGKRVPRPLKPRAFRRLTKWNKSGWPDFSMYQPIVEAAISERLVIVPASASRKETKDVSKNGLSALQPDDQAALALKKPFPSVYVDEIKKEIATGHCGLMPEKSLAPMSVVQRFRDAIMADALMNVSHEKGGILIAGNSHVRKDRAVPWYLINRGVPAAEIVTVIHREVRDGDRDPLEYVPIDDQGRPAVDFVVFTPAVKREDMCEKMREHMKKKKAAKVNAKTKQDETAAP